MLEIYTILKFHFQAFSNITFLTESWYHNHQRRYIFKNEEVKWSSARNRCENRENAILVSVLDESENIFLKYIMEIEG